MAYSAILKGVAPRFMGSVTSDFQAHPLIFDKNNEPLITSDWEHEMMRSIDGKTDRIKHQQDPTAFPKFHAYAGSYIERSAELGESMFRVSLDFARLCPKEGEFNKPLMAEYIKHLALIRLRGMEPMLALYHWPMPLYLTSLSPSGEIDQGGWEHEDAVYHFKFFINQVVGILSDTDALSVILRLKGFKRKDIDAILRQGLVKHIITLNEPSTFTLNGYIVGEFPPYRKRDFTTWNSVLAKLVEAHDIAYGRIKSIGPDVKAGIGYNWTYFDGWFGGWLQRSVNERIMKMFERDGSHSDFIGLQYYCRVTAPSVYPPLGTRKPKGRVYSDHPKFGDLYPEGIYTFLKRIHTLYPDKPLFVSEFGAVDRRDVKRPYVILETVRHILRAAREGVPINGILHWSIANNFEWEQGMDGQCGLFDEREIRKPLRSDGKLRSWQVWKALITALYAPSAEAYAKVDRMYEEAKQQFFK